MVTAAFSYISRIVPGVLAVSLGLIETSTAATVYGTIRAEGAHAENASGSAGNYGSRRYKFIDRVDYEHLSGFVVYVDQEIDDTPQEETPTARVIQRDGMFIPRVLAVARGTVVEFPNEDDIFHNVFSMSDSTPFDLGLYKRGETAKKIKFETPGRIDVFCSIHSRMNCIVLVVPNRFFAMADAQGRWSLPDLPPGHYRIRGWHERMPGKIVEVTVGADDVKLDIVLGLTSLPKH